LQADLSCRCECCRHLIEMLDMIENRGGKRATVIAARLEISEECLITLRLIGSADVLVVVGVEGVAVAATF
jgi:hypothetical protein